MEKKKNQIGWPNRPFQAYIYIWWINDTYLRKNKSASGDNYLLLLPSEGSLTDFLVEIAKLVEVDPTINKKASENTKMLLPISQTPLLRFKHHVLE